jgi:hypothetical protein
MPNLYASVLLLLTALSCSTSASINKADSQIKEEFQFQPSPSGFLISGEFVKVDGSEGRDFW